MNFVRLATRNSNKRVVSFAAFLKQWPCKGPGTVMQAQS